MFGMLRKDRVSMEYLMCSRLNRIVKVIVKVIDVNDVVLVMFLIHEAINAFHKADLVHVCLK